MKQELRPILRVVADVNIILNTITAKENSILWKLYQRFKRSEIRFLISQPLLNELKGENEAIYITVPIGIILTPEHLITITSAG